MSGNPEAHPGDLLPFAVSFFEENEPTLHGEVFPIVANVKEGFCPGFVKPHAREINRSLTIRVPLIKRFPATLAEDLFRSGIGDEDVLNLDAEVSVQWATTNKTVSKRRHGQAAEIPAVLDK